MVGLLISTARRLALKIASYGVMHLVVAILVAFAITRDWPLILDVLSDELSGDRRLRDRILLRLANGSRAAGSEAPAAVDEAVSAATG